MESGYVIAAVMAAAAAAGAINWVIWKRETHRRSQKDHLTGLMNDLAFAKRAGDDLERPLARSDEMILMMFDIDGLDGINRRFDRRFGDFILRLFAEKAAGEIGDEGLLFRLGADEFCSILPATSQVEATAMAGRISAAFSAKKLRVRKKQNVRPTVSVGLASSKQIGFSIDSLKAAANLALSEAKAAGGNCLIAYRADRQSGGDRAAAA